MTSDRGLCGGFNSIDRRAAPGSKIRELRAQGKEVKIFCVGRKGREQLRRDLGRLIVGTSRISASALDLRRRRSGSANAWLHYMRAGEFDVCHIIYNQFKSAIDADRDIAAADPLRRPRPASRRRAMPSTNTSRTRPRSWQALLPRNLGVQIYRALLENKAGEQGARMTAMDSATRNAGDMINKLTIHLQPLPPGLHHQGADRDHLRRRGGLSRACR